MEMRAHLSDMNMDRSEFTGVGLFGARKREYSPNLGVTMKYFIFNLVDGDRERAASFLNAKRWVVGREERHCDALDSGDLVLVFVAVTSEFVGRAKLETAFLDPIPVDPAASGPAVSGVLLADADAWTSGVPLAVAVQRIDPMGSNPYVQANAAGFRSGVVQITAEEYDKVLSLHDEERST